MNKEFFIRVSILIVMVGILINLPYLLEANFYQGLIMAIAYFQLGSWCALFANYLVRKFCD